MTRYITKDGLKKIQDELDGCKFKIRQEIARAIKEAKEQGDLSENAEYTEAKHRQNENENRIAELEMILKNSEVVEYSEDASAVHLGSRVRVKVNGKESEFQVVGSNEADPANFKISNESPIGRALMGRKKGEKVSVETPAGKISYAILEIR